MEILWKCTQCGSIMPCIDERCAIAPESCTDCGSPKEELYVVEED